MAVFIQNVLCLEFEKPLGSHHLHLSLDSVYLVLVRVEVKKSIF